MRSIRRRAKFGSEMEANKMKKTYEIPELKVALLERADVIVTSGEDEGELPVKS